MRSRGIWLTVLRRGVQLNSLTPSNGGTTAPISYAQCYKSGGVAHGVMQNTAETVALNAASKVGSRKRHLFIIYPKGYN